MKGRLLMKTTCFRKKVFNKLQRVKKIAIQWKPLLFKACLQLTWKIELTASSVSSNAHRRACSQLAQLSLVRQRAQHLEKSKSTHQRVQAPLLCATRSAHAHSMHWSGTPGNQAGLKALLSLIQPRCRGYSLPAGAQTAWAGAADKHFCINDNSGETQLRLGCAASRRLIQSRNS